jgi:hypothetical protein
VFLNDYKEDPFTILKLPMLPIFREEFNASIYFDQGIFLDLVDNLPTDLWQSLVGTVCCMAAVCFIFMNNFLTAFVATGTIASIVIGIQKSFCISTGWPKNWIFVIFGKFMKNGAFLFLRIS